jgi:hypothetical protein
MALVAPAAITGVAHCCQQVVSSDPTRSPTSSCAPSSYNLDEQG